MSSLLEQKSRPHFANADAVRRVLLSSAAKGNNSSASVMTTHDSEAVGVDKNETTFHSIKSMNAKISEALVGHEASNALTHFIFLGPAGSGQSSAADVLAKRMHTLGLVSTPAVVETYAGRLIGTSRDDASVEIDALLWGARGSVLLVNDAHDFMCSYMGFVALNYFISALNATENQGTVVILSGMESLMNDMIVREPALFGAFTSTIRLPRWGAEMCVDFILHSADADSITIESAAVEVLRRGFEELQNRPACFSVRDAVDIYLDLVATRFNRIATPSVDDNNSTAVSLITYTDAEAVMRNIISLRPRDLWKSKECHAFVGYAESKAREKFDKLCAALDADSLPPFTRAKCSILTPSSLNSTDANTLTSVAATADTAAVSDNLLKQSVSDSKNSAFVPPPVPLPVPASTATAQDTATGRQQPQPQPEPQKPQMPLLQLQQQRQRSFDFSRLRLPSIHGIRTPVSGPPLVNTLGRRSSNTLMHASDALASLELSDDEEEEEDDAADFASVVSDTSDHQRLFADFNKLEADATTAEDDFAKEWSALSATLTELSSPAITRGMSKGLTSTMSFGPGDIILPDIDGFDDAASFTSK